MDGGIVSIIVKLIEEGVIGEATLLGIIIAMLVWAYFSVAKPLQNKLKGMITAKELDDAFEKFTIKEEVNLKELSEKLAQLIKLLDEIEDLNKCNYREVNELRRDIEHIKQILNQIQGHLLFGGRRSGDFGNRELK